MQQDEKLTSVQLAKKEEIINAAQKLFARFGLRKTSVDEIAKSAQVAKGTIYNYFETKEEIFDEVVRREGNRMIDLINQAIEKEKSPAKKIRALILVKIKRIREMVNFYQVTREMMSELWPYHEGEREKFLNQEKEILSKILKEGVKKGQLFVRKLDLASHAIVTALKGLELEWILEKEKSQLEEEVDSLVDILMWGIARQRNK